MRKLVVGMAALTVWLTSCSDETVGVESEADVQAAVPAESKQESLHAFAQILSAAVADSREVRKFLKREALEPFSISTRTTQGV